MKTRDELNHISGIILNASIIVHREMGPGLLESVYQHCLIKELKGRALNVKTSFPIPLLYKGEALDKDYCIDILVEDEIIVELKATDGIAPIS
jgi:GxxExxY protein